MSTPAQSKSGNADRYGWIVKYAILFGIFFYGIFFGFIAAQKITLPFSNPREVVGLLTLVRYNPMNNILRFLAFVSCPVAILALAYLLLRGRFKKICFGGETPDEGKPPSLPKRRPVLTMFLVVFAALIAMNFFTYRACGGFDTFHEGEALGSAVSMMKGQIPCKDHIFAHGIYRDPDMPSRDITIFAFLAVFAILFSDLKEARKGRARLFVTTLLFSFIPAAAFCYSIDRGLYLTATYAVVAPLLTATYAVVAPLYDIAVIGAGPAGCMAAIMAGQRRMRVALIERNRDIGKKLLITGKGRCNLTNTASAEVFIEKFAPGGEFLRSAFFAFFNDDLIEFFKSKGLALKTERQGRVFPETDKARSVISVLEEVLKEAAVDVRHGMRIVSVEGVNGHFVLKAEDGTVTIAGKVIVAAGGASYKATGSTGDGYAIAKRFGHTITPLRPALVPLKTKEGWVKDLQGLALENIQIEFRYGSKRLVSDVGELMFTHFGVSGPLVLDMSGDVTAYLEGHKEVAMAIDFKPGLRKEQLESKFIHKFAVKGTVQMKNLLQDVLPKKMVPVFLSLLDISPVRRANQITQKERHALIDMLKAFPLTVTGSLPLEEAMVTAGGVSRKEINPRTMESRLVPGLYFAGEVIEGAAPSGGYNLQQAFSTGYLAGENAVHKLDDEE